MGTALGTLALGSLMIRWGRRRALLLGYALASLGAVLAISSEPWRM
jgi:MFS family permease